MKLKLHNLPISAHWRRATRWIYPDRSRPRRLLVHAGFHKTGSTALQYFLASAANKLRRRGILYPISGRAGSGHHNIAWQVTGNQLFEPSAGTIDDVAAEIAQFDGDAILSSEGFESLLEEPGLLNPLLLHPALREHESTVLIYVRNQSSYVESQYFSMVVGHGRGDEFMTFLQLALRYQLMDYNAIYTRWTACGSANLIVRNYHQLIGGSTTTDFCSIVCPDISLIKRKLSLSKINTRPPLRIALLNFYANRVQRSLERREEETIENICNALEGRPVTSSTELRLAFDRIFSTANQTLCRAAGLQETGLAWRDPAPVGAVPMERLFSLELHNIIAGNLPNLDVQTFINSLLAGLSCSQYSSFFDKIGLKGGNRD